MSAIGERWSVVSLGMSCQTALQINHGIPLLRTLLDDDTISLRACPFDWLIAPVESVIRLLQSGEFYPRSPADISINHRPYWQAANVYYWHEFKNGYSSEEFATVGQKYAHTAENLRWVAKSRRTLFLVSNTQNNLVDDMPKVGTVDFVIRGSSLAALNAQLRACFHRDFHLALVTYPDRYIDDVDQKYFSVEFIDKDESEWEGSFHNWQQALARLAEKVTARKKSRLRLARPARSTL
jgi:hypothetical protein